MMMSLYMRAPVHFGEKAALELLALLAGAKVAPRIQLLPRGAGFGQRLDLGAVARGGGLLPLADDLKIGDLFQAAEHRFAVGIIDLLPAGEIRTAFHITDLKGPVEMLLQKRNIFVEELLLQVLRSGGDHHALARKQRGNKIRESLAGSRAGVHQQLLLLRQRGFHRLRHVEFALAELVARVPFRQQTMPRKELARGKRLRRGRHPF